MAKIIKTFSFGFLIKDYKQSPCKDTDVAGDITKPVKGYDRTKALIGMPQLLGFG